MSYDAIVSARKDAERAMTESIREGIRMGLKMSRERKEAKAKTQ